VIHLWWIGESEADDRLLAGAASRLASEFDARIVQWRSPDRPIGTFDARRRQHSSRDVLRWLIARRPRQSFRVVGVTDVDLFIPVLTFVFGEAQLTGPGAVVSIARLAEPADPSRTAERLAKECVHELGHTFGLAHCHHASCVMQRSPSVAAVDRKGGGLCPGCRQQYRSALQNEAHHV
jgi:archaemetzincin